MAHFDDASKNWDQNPMYSDRASKTFTKIKENIKVNKDWICLEFGCGTGLLSFQFQKYVKKIDLIDTSEGMLSIVKDKIDKNNIDNMEIIKYEELENDKISNGKYNLVYTLMTFHHVKKYEHYLRVFNRSMKENGYFCIADLYQEDGSFHSHVKNFDGYNGFDPNEVIENGKKYGFTKAYLNNYYIVKKENKDYPLFLLILKKDRNC